MRRVKNGYGTKDRIKTQFSSLYDSETHIANDANTVVGAYTLRNLIDPDQLAVAKEIAQQLIGDNTAPYLTNTKEANAQFVKKIADKVKNTEL